MLREKGKAQKIANQILQSKGSKAAKAPSSANKDIKLQTPYLQR